MRKLWLILFVVAGFIATFGWLSFLSWLAWEAVSPMFEDVGILVYCADYRCIHDRDVNRSMGR